MKQSINWTEHILNFAAVILGVLLAFQISNMAENRKAQTELKIIYRSLIEELDNHNEVYRDFQIPFQKAQIANTDTVIEAIASGQPDEVLGQMSVDFRINNYFPTSSTYISAVSSGKLGLIADLKLKDDLITYYDILAKEAELRGSSQRDFLATRIVEWMIKNTDYLDADIRVFAKDREAVNSLLVYQGLTKNKVRQYEKLIDKGEELRSKLQEALNDM